MVRDSLKSKVERLYAMEQICFPQDPWSQSMFVEALTNPYSIVIIEDYGYAIGMRFPDGCELHNLAVLPKERGRGRGEDLLKRFLEKCEGDVFLEVASKNTAAVALYEKYGFEKIGLRKNYYFDDDAICYKKTAVSTERNENE